MEALQQAFLSNTFTTAAAQRRLGLLQRLLEAVVYEDEVDAGGVTARYEAARLALSMDDSDAAAVSAWGSSWVGEATLSSLHNFLEALRLWVAGLPELTMYVPVALDGQGETIIGTWCRQEVSPSIMLDIQVDATVIGGCAFVKAGHFHDYSLHGRFADNPSVVADVLDSYAS